MEMESLLRKVYKKPRRMPESNGKVVSEFEDRGLSVGISQCLLGFDTSFNTKNSSIWLVDKN